MNKQYVLGTAVKITTILDIDTATTAKITIQDAGQVAKVTSANMTKSADKIYYYIYQSASSDNYGDYVITITITYGGYTAVVQDTITFVNQLDLFNSSP